jgi:hypothetical protein
MEKSIKLAKRDQAVIDSLQIGTQKELVTNPFSGNSVELEPEALALYDYIKGCEASGFNDKLRQALYIFRKKWANEYMTLLD